MSIEELSYPKLNDNQDRGEFGGVSQCCKGRSTNHEERDAIQYNN